MSETKSGGKIVYHSENFRYHSEFIAKIRYDSEFFFNKINNNNKKINNNKNEKKNKFF